MKGSASLFADLPWALTLSLLELLRFGHCRWWWKLRFAAWEEFRDLDVSELLAKNNGRCELAYGETPTATLAKILELAALPHGGHFLDLGAGRGLSVLAAGLMGYRSSGIELLEEYVVRSRRIADKMALAVDLRVGNFLVDDWPRSDLILVNSTAFPENMRVTLQRRLAQLDSDTRIATFDWELPSQDFSELQALTLPVTRGTVLCRIYRKV